MKIVADENIEAEIVSALRAAGHEVIDIKTTQPGSDDESVLALAATEGSILLTNDKDFGELVYREHLFFSGVVLLRFGRMDAAERSEIIIHVLTERANDLVASFTVITPTGVRVRK